MHRHLLKRIFDRGPFSYKLVRNKTYDLPYNRVWELHDENGKFLFLIFEDEFFQNIAKKKLAAKDMHTENLYARLNPERI